MPQNRQIPGRIAFAAEMPENAFAAYSSVIPGPFFAPKMAISSSKIGRYQGGFPVFAKGPKTPSPPTVRPLRAPGSPQIGSFGFPKSTDTRAVCVFGVVCPKRPRPLQFPLGKTKKETFGQGKSTDTRAVCGFRTRPNPDTRAVCGFSGRPKTLSPPTVPDFEAHF